MELIIQVIIKQANNYHFSAACSALHVLAIILISSISPRTIFWCCWYSGRISFNHGNWSEAVVHGKQCLLICAWFLECYVNIHKPSVNHSFILKKIGLDVTHDILDTQLLVCRVLWIFTMAECLLSTRLEALLWVVLKELASLIWSFMWQIAYVSLTTTILWPWKWGKEIGMS